MDFKLPPLPNTLGEILQISSQEPSDKTTKRLVTIIQQDPAMAVYVLRQVNSAYYGVRRHVTQISKAVSLLGAKAVCNMVLTIALKKSFSYLENAAAQNVYEYLMKVSVATAAYARDLAVHLRLLFSETAFSAGLLHQLGRLVLLYSVPKLYIPLWYQKNASTGKVDLAIPSLESERAHFNVNYPELGATIMQKWGLPGEFSTIVGALHNPEEVPVAHLRILTHAVAAGSAFAETLFDADSSTEHAFEEVDGYPEPLVELANLRHSDVQELADFMMERKEDIRHFAQTVVKDL